MKDELLDLKNSKLILDGTEKDREQWGARIDEYYEDLRQDKNDRIQVYSKRKDFYTGNQGSYSNITGVIKDTKQKKGHTNQITNYAGKTTAKIAYSLANNPPKLTVPPIDPTDKMESAKAQGVQDYIDMVLDSKENRFWKKTYRRSCFIMGTYGDAVVKCFVDGDKIRIVGHDDMAKIMVAWNGTDPNEFDAVIAELEMTPSSIFEQFGIKVNEKMLEKLGKDRKDSTKTGGWGGNEWGTKTPLPTSNNLPTGKSSLPTLTVREFDSLDAYCITIEKEIVQLVLKDDVKYPRVKLWTIIKNIPNPPSPWSIADIDYLIDPQIELNENDNRSSDHLRVGNVQRYIAYNMGDFDPESMKTSSGQVIFINDPEGKARFEPVQTNINNFPDDQYHQRKLMQIYDMGLPKVNYGNSGADSGRSKAIDYQSSIDLVVFKRDSWELALQDLCEKIQIFGNFLDGDKLDVFTNDQREFTVRNVEFDWSDIFPITQSDKIVNIANKFNMIGIPFAQAYKELGYRNPDSMIEQLKAELKDPDLMTLRSKMWNLSQGLLEANNQAATMSQGMMGSDMGGGVNQPSPTLTPEQNSGSAMPMASKGGTTSFSSAAGLIAKTRQNMNAKGQ